jgi:hypothetical protein
VGAVVSARRQRERRDSGDGRASPKICSSEYFVTLQVAEFYAVIGESAKALDFPTLLRAILAEGNHLVLGVLPAVLGADAGLNCYPLDFGAFHGCHYLYHKVTTVIRIFGAKSGCLFNGPIVGFVHAFWYKPWSVLMPAGNRAIGFTAVPELAETGQFRERRFTE